MVAGSKPTAMQTKVFNQLKYIHEHGDDKDHQLALKMLKDSDRSWEETYEDMCALLS